MRSSFGSLIIFYYFHLLVGIERSFEDNSDKSEEIEKQIDGISRSNQI